MEELEGLEELEWLEELEGLDITEHGTGAYSEFAMK